MVQNPNEPMYGRKLPILPMLVDVITDRALTRDVEHRILTPRYKRCIYICIYI